MPHLGPLVEWLYGPLAMQWIAELATVPSFWPASVAFFGVLAFGLSIEVFSKRTTEKKRLGIARLRDQMTRFYAGHEHTGWSDREDTDFVLLRDEIRDFILRYISESDSRLYYSVGYIDSIPYDEHAKCLAIMRRDIDFLSDLAGRSR